MPEWVNFSLPVQPLIDLFLHFPLYGLIQGGGLLCRSTEDLLQHPVNDPALLLEQSTDGASSQMDEELHPLLQ